MTRKRMHDRGGDRFLELEKAIAFDEMIRGDRSHDLVNSEVTCANFTTPSDYF